MRALVLILAAPFASAAFTAEPYPAWTAVGTTGLLWDRGLIEIQLIARVP